VLENLIDKLELSVAKEKHARFKLSLLKHIYIRYSNHLETINMNLMIINDKN
ncbi:12658_t:CDS:1, partial [Racocetra persica]